MFILYAKVAFSSHNRALYKEKKVTLQKCKKWKTYMRSARNRFL